MRKSIFLSLLTVVGTIGVTVLIILFAKGYWYNPQTGQVIRTGLLAVNSSPTGASIYVDNKLSNATNATIKLQMGTYEVRIEKEGYQSWKKEIRIAEEMVTPIFALLTPSSPELKPLTLSGASHPALSPDGTTIAYTTQEIGAGQRPEQTGIWTLILNGKRPFGIPGGGKPVQVAADTPQRPFSQALLAWSPNQDRLLAIIPETPTNNKKAKDQEEVLTQKEIEQWLNNPTNIPQELNVYAWLLLPDTEATRQLPQPVDDLRGLLANWKNSREFTIVNLISLYPEAIRREATSSAWLKISQDEKHLLYPSPDQEGVTLIWKGFTEVEKRAYAKPDQSYPAVGSTNQPGKEATSPASIHQPQSKEVVARYELPAALAYEWLPEKDNNHLVMLEKDGISIIEADGQNKVPIYTGEYQENFLVPWPDGSKLLILTSLNRATGTPANLYTLSLR